MFAGYPLTSLHAGDKNSPSLNSNLFSKNMFPAALLNPANLYSFEVAFVSNGFNNVVSLEIITPATKCNRDVIPDLTRNL